MSSSDASPNGALLSVRKLTKLFGSFAACNEIDIDIQPGEIHALLGENGAGKSTLVKMLFGVLEPSDGDIVWQGNAVSIPSPGDARRLGIGMVFQHFSLFEALTVAENIALSLDDNIPIAKIAEEAAALSEAYGLPLDPFAHVADLSVGERQRIEIVRALLQNPKLIILDEPTSVLTPQEADRLFETLFKLRAEGRSVLYISHRLEEVQRICDRATVLRHGRVTGACDPKQETTGSLARMMVGSDVASIKHGDRGEKGEIQLEIAGLSVHARTPFAISLSQVSLRVRAGEILAIAGVAGNGQGELFDVISGEFPVVSDDLIFIRGEPVGTRGITARRLLGAGFVPEERHGHAAVTTLSLSDNLVLARSQSDRKAFLGGGALQIIRRAAVTLATKRISEAMDVRKSGEDPMAGSLSGGNLQKFIVGRELDRQPDVLVVNQPTWGVDAGAASRIRQALVDLAKAGSAVLVISQDLDEIFEVATEIAVISDGHLSPSYPAGEMTREKIGLLMGGTHGVSTEAEPAHAH
ncbi:MULTISPECIES: ABC transporter ATP-binding protein [Rhizobium]|uniref:ABC transporter ATP-binding protein n=1 Tax=Rhizobium rhododendri TaxID=2506430 RepID=A0ABY8IL18_9HYPH|nr:MULTISPECIES: ABC transporter ATP-binding protein [Rhizobium]MBZ5757980.1 ABC transporter ATP-binding protein [Rhizobium sp. VS19-DR96]MBZ5765190.1 ABC transporter ATP-binding protein [Rhizobium sp. VS19-DR129.2]MBZ5772733.1 ABC transporter ATP-binding protein [Rhizobium sp. VS19-DRK62.2]MBZ5782580.1 ABC transporter ATP-binding protein [Rhizobium sp. VS19-DR121]MBZ5800028.1 ABC transporter ATP-binding protein [Rhizobium sp. VS19-DR181]